MIHYRFPILFALCISCLGFTPNQTHEFILSSSSVRLWRTELIAQAASTTTRPVETSSYDRYMQAGYAAAREGKYKAATEQFKKALAERPQDIYAQQASQNMELYLLKNPTPTLPWLILGGVAIAVVTGTGVLLVSRMLSKSPKADQNKQEFPSDSPLENDTESLSESLDKNRASDNNHTASEASQTHLGDNNYEVQTTLPIQVTTRIPNLDHIEELIKDLQSTESKKRRKAIWKLAQKSDSRAMKPLVDLMIDTDSQERSLILEALSQISSRTLKPMNQALAISLQDKNPQVRQNAIRDLTRIYDLMSQISQLLSHAIDDSDIDVKETAKWALNQLNLQIPPRIDLLTRQQNEESSVEESYTESAER